MNYDQKIPFQHAGTPAQFRRSFKLMHWIMALLFLLAIASIEVKARIQNDVINRDLMWVHIQSGTALFLLVWLRIVMRVRLPVPPIIPAMKRVHHISALLAHAGLYLLTIAIPLLGIIALQTRGVNVHFMGITLPVIISENQGLPYSLALISYHEQYGNYLIYLILAHIAFAFIHHFFWKDNTLQRMLPDFRKKPVFQKQN